MRLGRGKEEEQYKCIPVCISNNRRSCCRTIARTSDRGIGLECRECREDHSLHAERERDRRKRPKNTVSFALQQQNPSRDREIQIMRKHTSRMRERSIWCTTILTLEHSFLFHVPHDMTVFYFPGTATSSIRTSFLIRFTLIFCCFFPFFLPLLVLPICCSIPVKYSCLLLPLMRWANQLSL